MIIDPPMLVPMNFASLALVRTMILVSCACWLNAEVQRIRRKETIRFFILKFNIQNSSFNTPTVITSLLLF